ncbi:peptidoglycan-binding protein [Acidobacterium sp. S8]|uniref:peptidoglycan-binding domain-containing protein n=1 Tax=Acidobacterium sp. S8 TaxID=1641854 RepID=UPI00131AF596|nr:peptidoglycan-binding domain-containing protein [Acidobacterium sp. S8]
MSFSDAISKSKIKLVTPTATISSVLEHEEIFRALDPTSSTTSDVALLKSLPPEIRRHFLADYGNPRRLDIVNISGEPLEFHATNAALGVADAPVPLLPAGTGSQTSLWIAQIQNGLAAQGYQVPTDGKMSATTEVALREFQRKYNLPETGTPTDVVAVKLRRLTADQWLTSVSNEELLVVNLEQHPKSQYRLRAMTTDGKVIYNGNAIHALVNSIAKMPEADGKVVYVNPIDFSSIQADNLRGSFRMADSDVPIEVLPRSDESSLLRDIFLTKGVKVDEVEIDSEEVTVGPKKGWFHSVIRFAVNLKGKIRTLTADIWTRTKLQMSQFMQANGLREGQEFDNSVSLALIVSRGRKQLIKNGGKSNDLDAQIRMATMRFWAELASRRTSDNGV